MAYCLYLELHIYRAAKCLGPVKGVIGPAAVSLPSNRRTFHSGISLILTCEVIKIKSFDRWQWHICAEWRPWQSLNVRPF